MLYTEHNDTNLKVSTPSVSLGQAVPYIVDNVREKDEPKLSLESNVTIPKAQLLHNQKKVEENLCQFEVESNVAQLGDSDSICTDSDTEKTW